LKRALIVSKDPKYEGWEADAENGAERLAGKVAKLTVVVTVHGANGEGDAGHHSDVAVTIDGERLAPTLVGTELERDPGTYTVKVQSRDAVAPVEQEVALGTGEAKRVSLVLTLRPAPVPVAATSPVPKEEPPRGASTGRVLGWTAVGIGGASLVGALVSLIVRQNALGDLKSACPGYQSGPCDPSVKSIDDRGKLASTLVTVFGAVGLVALGGGVTLLLTAPSSSSAPTSAGLSGRWSF
jgi:hypothetical protein